MLSLVGSPTISTVTGVGITPTGAAAGNILLALVSTEDCNEGVDFTGVPAGWSEIATVNNSAGTGGDDYIIASLYWFSPSSAPASTYSGWTIAGVQFAINVMMICYSGQAASPIDSGAGAPTTAGGAGTSIAMPALTTTNANEQVLVFVAFDDDTSVWTPPSGFAQQGLFSSSGLAGSSPALDFGDYSVSNKLLATAGSTGTVTMSPLAGGAIGGGTDYAAIMCAIIPSVASGGIPVPYWAA